MSDIRVITDRLELIAGTPELARAEIGDRSLFSRLLGARVPASWPPPLNDADSMEWFARYLEENPDGVGWSCWYFVLRGGEAGGGVAIGNGGFKGKPTADGTVEIGYSLLAEYQGKGYATEAVRSLLAWAFSHPHVGCVIAETYPDLWPSIRVLEKSGFTHAGEDSGEGIIRFALSRAEFEEEQIS